MKSAVAPAFAARALKVRSWAGMNLLGGGDGEVLGDPERARSKLESKGRVLEEILGYPVEAPIRIEDVRDMGEWKTAWDHIVFEGFLGVRMKLQFVWEGCDSTLAAPLLLDLVRLMVLALERGERGVISELAFFFKDPGGDERARAAPPVRDARTLGVAEGHGVSLPAAADLAELVRLPAVLSVPGDVLVGAAASGQVREVRRTAGLVASSSCLYSGRDGAERLCRPRCRRGRAAWAADPVGARHAAIRARVGRWLDRGRRAARGRRRRVARARRRRAAGGRRVGLRPGAEVDVGGLGRHVGLPRAGRPDGRGGTRRAAGAARGRRGRRAHRGRDRGVAARGDRRRPVGRAPRAGRDGRRGGRGRAALARSSGRAGSAGRVRDGRRSRARRRRARADAGAAAARGRRGDPRADAAGGRPAGRRAALWFRRRASRRCGRWRGGRRRKRAVT